MEGEKGEGEEETEGGREREREREGEGERRKRRGRGWSGRHYALLNLAPVSMALDSCVFHCSATSLARGSSGLGADNRPCMDSNTVLI